MPDSNTVLPAKKRALALAGGGPAVGISLGFLKALQDPEFRHIKFDVWTLSCVGAWLGCLYHLSPKRAPEQKLDFVTTTMRGFFRDDDVYASFPFPTIFMPDIPEMIAEGMKFMVDPKSYANLIVPSEIAKGYQQLLDFYLTPSKWNRGDFSYMVLNALLAPNPFVRFALSMIWKSQLPGLSKIWFGPDFSVLNCLDMRLLQEPDVPILYHNAYDVDRQELQLFSNRHSEYPKITAQTLCACSGLPYILSPVVIDGTTYVEGATVDTVGFYHLLKNHKDLDEVWVSQILSRKQIHPHHNLIEALNNLVMLFASTTTADDVKLFRFHLDAVNAERRKQNAKEIDLIVLKVDPLTNYEWTHSNFDASVDASYHTSRARLEKYVLSEPVS